MRRNQEWEGKWRQNEQAIERRIAEYENKIRIMDQEI